MTDPGGERLLFLAQTLPYPPDGGVQIRTYNILRLLSRRFDVTALCFYRRASHPTPEHVERSLEGLSELAEVEAFPIPQEHSRPQLLLDHAVSSATGRVYTVRSYRSSVFRERIRQLLCERTIRLVHVDSLDLSGYLRMVSGIPTVCTHHNVESALLRRRAEQESSSLRRAYLRYQSRLMRREEARWAPRVALNATVSPADAELLRDIAPGARTRVVPNGVDTRLFQPAAGGEDGIVFVGGYTWFPNRDALGYFAEQILPLIRKKDPDVPVRWIGRAPAAVREEYREHHAIELTGYVDSIQPLVGRAACYVVPLRVGGGTRLKILDAWAMGKAVVSTRVGCEGLDARDGENILIRDEPAGFADAVHQVLRDRALRERLGNAARKTVETTYDWDVIGQAMIPAYEELLDPDAAERTIS